MKVRTTSVTDLGQCAGGLLDEVERTGRPTLVTRDGKPIAVVMAVNSDALVDYVLANAPEYVQGRADADAELARGDTRSLISVLADRDGVKRDFHSRGVGHGGGGPTPAWEAAELYDDVMGKSRWR